MEKAKAIANAMLLTQKSKKTPFKQYKKSFDTVINAMVPSEEGEGEGCCGDDDDERGGGGGGGGYKQESMRYSGGGGGGG